MAENKNENHVEKIKLKSFRFLTDSEIEAAKIMAKMKEEDPEKVRLTRDVEVWARPTVLSNGHRILEFTASENQFVLHSKDLKTILSTQDYEVIDLRPPKKDK